MPMAEIRREIAEDRRSTAEAGRSTIEGSREPADEHPVTWLELFFDLVFAAVVAALGTLLGDHPTPGGLLAYLAIVQCVFWVWASHTVYTSRFGDHDLTYRLYTFALVLLAAVMAVQIPQVLDASPVGFVLTYVAARGLLVALHFRPRWRFPDVKETNLVYIAGSLMVMACWAASAFVPPPARYALWGLGVAIDLAFPWFARAGLRRFPVHARHLPERLGLFVLLVLGEAILAIVGGLSSVAWSPGPLIAAGLAGVAAGCVWWTYFSFTDLADHECSLGNGLPFIYGHFPLVAAMAALAVGIHHAIPEAAGARLVPATAMMFGFGTAAWIGAFLVLQRLAERSRLSRAFVAAYLAAALGAAALVPLAAVWPPLAVLAVGVAIMVALVGLEVRFHDDEMALMLAAEHGRPIPRIFVEELRARLARGDHVLIVDVRRNLDDYQIPGSVRFDPDTLLAAESVVLPYDRDMLVVTYCT